MEKGFSSDERRKLLEKYFKYFEELNHINREYDEGLLGISDHDEIAALEEKLLPLMAEKKAAVDQLRMEYLKGLPVKALSRCPFTGHVLMRSIDLYGIDGLWWDYNNPARHQEELLPTFFAMDGALKLGTSLEKIPFTVSVGPEVPFVLPRLLKHEQIKAVLSCFPIGNHELFLITYYSEPMLNEIRRVNDLGTYFYKYPDIYGLLLNDFYQDPVKDFHLEQWILSGKLLWIKPGDHSLILRSYLEGCPYLGLTGRQKVLAIYNGEITEVEEPEWILETSEFLPDESDGVPLEEVAKEILEKEGLLLEPEDIYQGIDVFQDEEIQIDEEEYDWELARALEEASINNSEEERQ